MNYFEENRIRYLAALKAQSCKHCPYLMSFIGCSMVFGGCPLHDDPKAYYHKLKFR